MSAAAEARVRESFARQTLMTTIGASVVMVGEGTVTLTCPIKPEFQQQQAFGHGGLVFSLGDTAAGYAALSVMPPEVEVMTAELKINFLAPADGPLVAEGRVIKSGRRLVVVGADVFADQGDGSRKMVAVLVGTMVAVEKR